MKIKTSGQIVNECDPRNNHALNLDKQWVSLDELKAMIETYGATGKSLFEFYEYIKSLDIMSKK